MKRSDAEKNVKAGTITGLICGVLLFLALIISWKPPAQDTPTDEEGMEVNLGDMDQGSGEVQPMSPEPPAPMPEDVAQTPRAEAEQAEEKEVETNDDDREAPEVVAPKPPKPVEKKRTPSKPAVKPEAPKAIVKAKEKKVVLEKPKADPKPKLVFKGVSGSQAGGNESDSWNHSRGQGITGGRGDQGKPGGSPDADSYSGSGGSGNGAVSISKGLRGRSITRFPAFEDDFNENAKVAVDIRVDANGKVMNAVYQPKGSTTNDMNMRTIAIRKALQLKFNVQPDGPETDIGTIIFNFKVR